MKRYNQITALDCRSYLILHHNALTKPHAAGDLFTKQRIHQTEQVATCQYNVSVFS